MMGAGPGDRATTYLLHGLRITSQIPLDAPATGGGEPDLVVRVAERRPIPDAVPPGGLLARLQAPTWSSSLTRGRSGYTLRMHGRCDFEIDPAVRVLRVHPAPDVDDEVPGLLVGGALAAALALRGCCVLHASAVRAGDLVTAFVGSSGSGKTTVAALCCAAGADLATDDVLRVESVDGQGWCYRGSSVLRLRPTAAELATALSASSRRFTLDGRVAVGFTPLQSSCLPLGAIVAPVPTREFDEPRLTRLRGSDAVLELVRHPRTVGWRNAEAARRDLKVLGSLARTVPVFRADVPWGPPFAADLGDRLLRGISAHSAGAS